MIADKDPLAARAARTIVSHPKAIAFLLAILGFGSAALVRHLRVETGMEAFLAPDAPEWETLHKVENVFVNDQVLFVGYETDDPFSAQRLDEVRSLSDRLEKIKVKNPASGASRLTIDDVTSLTNVKTLQGSDLFFRTIPLVADPLPTANEDLRAIRAEAYRMPSIRDWLLGTSPDANTAGIVLRLVDELSDHEIAATVAATRKILATANAEHPATRYFLSGEPVANADMARYQREDLEKFMPVSYALVVVLLFAFVGRIKSIAAALVGVSITLLGALAMLIIIGGSLNNCSAMIPPVTLALAVAMMLHYFSEMGKQSPQESQLGFRESTLKNLLPPATMAAVTTAIGFASLAVSSVPAIKHFGVAAAGGMIIGLIVAATIFAILARRPDVSSVVAPWAVARTRAFSGLMNLAGRFVLRWPKVILGGGLIFLALVTFGITRLNVDMQPMHFFEHRSPIRRSNSFIEKHLGGTSMFVIAIESDEADAFTKPKNLRRVEALQNFLLTDIGLKKTTSLADFVKEMHRAFFSGDDKYRRVPDDRSQVAQLLLLAGDERMDEYVDEQRKWVRIVGRSESLSTKEILKRYRAIGLYVASHFPKSEGFSHYETGRLLLNAELTTRLIDSQVNSLAISSFLIFGLVFLMFRSLIIGAIAILPNILPVAANLGLMGWIGINLDAATVMISTVALGIAVDDTVHFLQYWRKCSQLDSDIDHSILETLRLKGPAIVWTSVVITAGFSVLTLSNFLPTRNFGALICAAMATALVADIFVLPALLLVIFRRPRTSRLPSIDDRPVI